MNIKFGLEKEMFILKDGQPSMVPTNINLPYDECGLMVEARGNAHDNPVDAIYSLRASIYKLERLAQHNNLVLTDVPIMKIPREVQLAAARVYTKGLIHYQNLYGHKSHRNKLGEFTTGVHISFTNQTSTEDKNGNKQTFNLNFDWFKIFNQFDNYFKKEIQEAKRNPGFYEIKGDGRIEYRSLPANVNLEKVSEILEKIMLDIYNVRY